MERYLIYEYGFSKVCNATYGGQRAVIKLRKQCQFLHLFAAVFYLEATKYTCNIRVNFLPPMSVNISEADHHLPLTLNPGFHMVVMVVKIESRSFSTASL